MGENPLITIGINPSTAAPDALDNTLKSVERVAKGNGKELTAIRLDDKIAKETYDAK